MKEIPQGGLGPRPIRHGNRVRAADHPYAAPFRDDLKGRNRLIECLGIEHDIAPDVARGLIDGCRNLIRDASERKTPIYVVAEELADRL